MEVKTCLDDRGCNSTQWLCRAKICCCCFSELLKGRSLAKKFVMLFNLYRIYLLPAWLPESGVFRVVSERVGGSRIALSAPGYLIVEL